MDALDIAGGGESSGICFVFPYPVPRAYVFSRAVVLGLIHNIYELQMMHTTIKNQDRIQYFELGFFVPA